MAKFPVSENKIQDLERRFEKLGVTDHDLVEEFVKGSGAGGQKINKTSMAVWLKHTPTGIEVRCQESRSQALNRFIARRLLAEKLEEKFFREASECEQAREKIRRQKRKRSKRAKEKMLAGKRQLSLKKSARKVSKDDF